MWECVGGPVVKGEDSLQGVIRDTKEEVGVDLNPENGQVLFTKTRKIIDGKIYNDIMVAWLNREQIKELFEHNMFVETLEYFFTEVMQNDADLGKLCVDSVELINYARNIVVKHVNIVQIMTYYSLGRWIVETQQMGEKRAKYGSKVIKTLSEKLQEEFGKGFSEDTLKNARKFYLTYKERISETVFSLFAIEKK